MCRKKTSVSSQCLKLLTRVLLEVSLVYINSVTQSLQSTNVTLSFSVLKSGHTENKVALLVCSTSKVFKRQKRKKESCTYQVTAAKEQIFATLSRSVLSGLALQRCENI